MIRWLHISDLHIKDRADWNNFERELLEKCKEFGKINIIIVTGDFHNFCEKENFILAKEFLVRLTEQLELDINKDLFIVPGNHDGVTKVDCKNTHIKALKKDTIIKFVNDKYQSLKESFAPNVGKMDLCYLYAYGIAEKEEKEKMEELLLNFMKEDDFHIQERMEEEPIKVERQMDKFKMRG